PRHPVVHPRPRRQARAGRHRAARQRSPDRRPQPQRPARQPPRGLHPGDPMKRLACAALLLLAATPARAQDVEVPVLVMESPEAETGAVDTELNLANLVQTAAKGVTTVQEAPAIITIIPGDEIADRGARNLGDVLDRIPGWLRYGGEYSQFDSVNPRGQF